jgi:beta propeller repeat protein
VLRQASRARTSVVATCAVLAAFGLAACDDRTEPAAATPSGRRPLADVSVLGETPVSTHGADQRTPSVSGTRVVSADFANGDWGIYLYDLVGGTRTPISPNPAIQENPAISGDRIVWEDHRNGSADIYTYDLSAGVETRLTTSPEPQLHPDISGDWVVWAEFNAAEVYLYHIPSATTTRIAAAIAVYPAISGTRVVWQGAGEQLGHLRVRHPDWRDDTNHHEHRAATLPEPGCRCGPTGARWHVSHHRSHSAAIESGVGLSTVNPSVRRSADPRDSRAAPVGSTPRSRSPRAPEAPPRR